MKKLVTVVTVIFVIAVAALAYGQMSGHGHDMGHGHGKGEGMMACSEMGSGMKGGCGMCGHMMGDEHPMWKHLTDLNLDEQQKTAIAEIRSKVMKETIKRNADKQVAHLELKELLLKEPVDMKAVEAKLKQMETIKTELKLSHIRAMEEVKAKLTPEQRKKFKEMIGAGSLKGGMGMMHHREHGMMREHK